MPKWFNQLIWPRFITKQENVVLVYFTTSSALYHLYGLPNCQSSVTYLTTLCTPYFNTARSPVGRREIPSFNLFGGEVIHWRQSQPFYPCGLLNLILLFRSKAGSQDDKILWYIHTSWLPSTRISETWQGSWNITKTCNSTIKNVKCLECKFKRKIKDKHLAEIFKSNQMVSYDRD